jgi:hypothetical protein
MPSDGGHDIFAKSRGNFAKLTKLPSSFVNLLEAVFYGFGKNPRMPSTFSKLLELLCIIGQCLSNKNEKATVSKKFWI